MKLDIHRGDLLGGLAAGLLTGLGVGLLLAPRRGQAADVLRGDVAYRLTTAAPLIFEAGLMVLTQTRPVLGRLAWSIVHLAGRARSQPSPS